MPYIEKLWKTKGRHTAVKAYYESMSSTGATMSRAAEAVDKRAKEENWGEAAKVETTRFERIGV